MKGAAADPDNRINTPINNITISIGASHHFLLVLKKSISSPKSDCSVDSFAILEKSSLCSSLMSLKPYAAEPQLNSRRSSELFEISSCILLLGLRLPVTVCLRFPQTQWVMSQRPQHEAHWSENETENEQQNEMGDNPSNWKCHNHPCDKNGFQQLRANQSRKSNNNSDGQPNPCRPLVVVKAIATEGSKEQNPKTSKLPQHSGVGISRDIREFHRGCLVGRV